MGLPKRAGPELAMKSAGAVILLGESFLIKETAFSTFSQR